MSKKIEWNRVTWYSQLIAIILFVGVFMLGLYLGARYSAANPGAFGMARDDFSASAEEWQAGFPLAPAAEATTTAPKAVVKPKATTAAAQTPAAPPPPVETKQTQPAPVQPAATPAPAPVPPVVAVPAPVPAQQAPSTPAAGESRFSAYITAYTYWDNTPPGSSDISDPIIHQKAGGTGTFADPITLAVGHSYAGGVHTLDYAPGTKFYLPYLKKYFIVEDTCGDGSHPENGPCHTGYQGHPWLDLWIDGANGTRSSTNACAEELTEVHAIIENPASNYAVVPGPVYNDGCAQQFGDTPLTNV
jgi:hypothetical protein